MSVTPASGERVHALLTDGTTVCVRPARPDDQKAVLRLYSDMSDASLRLRFFSVSRRSAEQAAARVAQPEDSGYRALVAEHGGRIIGIAEYQTGTGKTADSAEISIAVGDGRHHHGVGTLLLEHLISAARAHGVRTFTADALAENHEMLKVFSDLGLHAERRIDGPEVHCVIPLDETEDYLRSVERRGQTADVASLVPLLRPRCVAVVGAGRRAGSVGRAVLHNLTTGRFAGQLYAVNPVAESILGVHACAAVSDLPRIPDLAVIAVPATDVARVAEECGRFGVRALLVVSSGLDARQARELLAACREHDIRLVGPNCLGLANTEDRVRLDATFAAAHTLPGSAGVAVQSGGVGIALLGGLERLGIGVSSFVSLGDKYDVSGNDLLQWWESDGRTDLALLHLESFGNPRAFSRTARRVTRRMPILTVDAGRTEAGRRAAAASHTATAATTTMTRRALFAQAGITATRTIPELLETAALLHTQPLPADGRVVVVTNAGGAGVLAADACAEAGLILPPLPPGLVDDLLSVLPPGASTANPVDATAAVTEEQLRTCVDRLATHDGIDAVLVALVPTAVATATGDVLVKALTDAPARRSRTIAAVLLDQDAPVRLLPSDTGQVPAYADPQAAARALAHAAERARWLARPPGTVPALEGIDTSRGRAVVERFLKQHPDGGWLDPRTCAGLLDCYGIPQSPWAWAETEDEAVWAADRLKGPDGHVVLKAHWPGLVHKTARHAIHLDLRGDLQVRAAFRDFDVRFGHIMTGAVVQPLAPRGIELFAGVVQDEVFGPLILFGLGGTATEVLADHAARLSPLTDQDVHDLITAPRCAPLLFRRDGTGPVDLPGLEQLLLRLSRMASDLPQLVEADFNPVLARPEHITALDARIRLLPRRAQDPYLRRLR